MVDYGNVKHPAADVLQTVKGQISKKSMDPKDVIPDAVSLLLLCLLFFGLADTESTINSTQDVIVLCMPVHQYRNALTNLAPYINRSKKDVFVGTVYGQAGFNWMVHEMERANNLTNVVAFAIGLIPWICRTVKYGELGANYGTKAVNVAAVT
jgi:hypothetical protein